MKNYPRVTLEQWRTFHAIVEQGGYAQAASYLNRSQSAVSYAIAKLQNTLGLALLKVEGRKAILTEQGHVLLQRSRHLVEEATDIENVAQNLSQGREAEIRLVVDAVFPNNVLMDALSTFAQQSQGTRVQLREVILSGATDALLSNDADIVIGVELPTGFLADPIIEVELIAVAHADHPLHQLNREILNTDLTQHMHVVIQDSGQQKKLNVGWLSADDSWTVSSIDSALSAIINGLGYGWIPSNRLDKLLDDGTLKILKLEQGTSYKAFLYLSFGKKQQVGPATREFASIIKECVNKM